jgi:transposase
MTRLTNSSPPQWAVQHRTAGTELKKIKGKYYLYKVSSVYDRQLKKTRKVSLDIIGSISEEHGLVPSHKAKLKKQLEQPIAIGPVYCREYGFSYWLNTFVKNEIQPALQQHFPQQWKIIIALAYCRILHQSPIKNIPFHLSNSSLLQMLELEPVDEKAVSAVLRTLGRQRKNMVAYMQALAEPQDCILVDATNIACHSRNITLARKGYNSQMNFEPQFTLLYIYSASKHKPVFFRIVPGNIRDVTLLSNTLAESGIEKSVFIADKGFYSEHNIEKMEEVKIKYLLPLRRNNKAIDYERLKDIERENTYFKYRDRFIFYATCHWEGRPVCLFYDGRLKEEEKNDYLSRIESLPEQYSREKYLEKVASMGTIAILHNTSLPTAQEVYEHYKGRGEIEQFFDCFKNTIDAFVSYMQNEEALQGWMFINHIAMQIIYSIFEQLKQAKLTKKHSIADAVMHLSNIKKIQVNNDKYYISEINKATKTLLQKLKLSVT